MCCPADRERWFHRVRRARRRRIARYMGEMPLLAGKEKYLESCGLFKETIGRKWPAPTSIASTSGARQCRLGFLKTVSPPPSLRRVPGMTKHSFFVRRRLNIRFIVAIRRNTATYSGCPAEPQRHEPLSAQYKRPPVRQTKAPLPNETRESLLWSNSREPARCGQQSSSTWPGRGPGEIRTA